MPELPEVETIRGYLTDILPGERIIRVAHLDARLLKEPGVENDAEWIQGSLTGQVVQSVSRRGKFLFLDLTTGAHLLIHLGMSGRLTLEPRGDPWKKHTHLVLEFPDTELRLVDPRRFGRIGWVPAGKALRPDLGVEPLSAGFTRHYLSERFKGRTAPVKSLLLDQRIVAGLGNIYADEALFRARIHPTLDAGRLSEEETARLVRAIRAVLRDSIRYRGTSFSDYVDALGHPGENQNYLRVYGRMGQPCFRCRRPIVTVVIQKRTSHFCPRCQRIVLGRNLDAEI